MSVKSWIMFLIFISIWFLGTDAIIFFSSLTIFILLKLKFDFSFDKDGFDAFWLRIKAADDCNGLDIFDDADVLILRDNDEFDLKRPKRLDSFIDLFKPKFKEESFE